MHESKGRVIHKVNLNKRVLELSVMAGEILLHNGAEIFRVQETMLKISEAYHADSLHVYVISNGIFACVNDNGEIHSTEIRHVPLSPVHLGRVAAVNQLSREIVSGKYTIEEAFDQLNKIREIPYTSNVVQVLASGLGSACFCYIFGGSVRDSLTAFLSGVILWIFILAAGKKKMSKIMTNILGSSIVTLCGIVFFRTGMGEHLDKLIIGSIIPLVPGVPLTTAIRDFMNSDYLSGTIRLIDAVLIAFCIAVGVGFILKLWSLFSGVAL
jgi:uncharacterized membrane protein YjjP (DUF1212 family)